MSPGTPLNSSSIGRVTLWYMSSGEAPGKFVCTEICGGATLGYCATGRSGIAIAPAIMMKMATTQAKMGRLMKKLGMAFDFVSTDGRR